jgi:serine/threonine protein kinase
VARTVQEVLAAELGPGYTIERPLRSGTIARAFLAREHALDRLVVVKVLPRELAIGVNAARFRREIRLAARLQHPNIVPMLSAGESDLLLHYAMPYISGESLRQRLDRDGTLPIPEVIALLAEVADALSAAHEVGYVHRDIKPDNILLSHGHALITDFGVAKALADAARTTTGDGHLTSVGSVVGTPTYMSPEQAAADPATDHRADLYAVGVTAYELLGGKPPFTNRTTQQLLAAHAIEPPPPLRPQRTDLPPALERLVMRLLAKDPDARYQTAAALRSALNAISTGADEPPEEPRQRPPAHSRKWWRPWGGR